MASFLKIKPEVAYHQLSEPQLFLLREQSLRMLQTGAEEILLGYETIF